jgi:hypothetical protein
VVFQGWKAEWRKRRKEEECVWCNAGLCCIIYIAGIYQLYDFIMETLVVNSVCCFI